MSNLSTYYSFNTPDVNLNGQIQNWATGIPVYDASLNGGAYISTSNYKTGNGSLEFPKNDISSQATTNVSFAQPSAGLHFSITDDQLTVLCSVYGGLTYYQTRSSTSNSFSNIWTSTNTNDTTNRAYYDIPVTGNGNRFVTCVQSGFVYFASKNTGSSGYSSLTKTSDNTTRNYQGLAMTKDGNRIVASAGNDGIYFANWNGSNYDAFTATLEKNATINYYGIGISSNGDRLVYGDISTKKRYLSFWNGSNYNTGTLIRTTLSEPRSCCFNNDSSLLFLSYYGSTYTVEFGKYNNKTNSYDTFTNVNTTLIPTAIDCRSVFCIESSNRITIYANNNGGNIYYGDISYNTTTTNYCAINTSPITSTNGLTICFWCKLNYNTIDAYNRIFDFGNTNGVDNFFFFINAMDISNNIYLLGSYYNSTLTQTNSTTKLSNNVWYHFAITLPYSTPSITPLTQSTATVYINAVYDTTSNIFYPANTTRNKCYVGKSILDNTKNFIGNIDDFRIYNTVLSASDISTIYSNTNVKNNYINSSISLLSVANPNVLNGLTANFDANVNVTSSANKVSNWKDKYKNVSLSQSTGTRQPSLASNFINQYPAIDFGSVAGSVLTTTSLNPNTTDITLFFVMKVTSNNYNNYRNFCSSIGGTFSIGTIHAFIWYDNIIFSLSSDTVNNNFYTDFKAQLNTPFIIMYNITSVTTGGSIGKCRYNGVNNSSNVTHNSSNTISIISDFELGGLAADNARTFPGGIGEFIQYNRTLAFSEILSIENYLSLKWGIALSNQTHYYWNDPYAMTNTIINKSNPCNFYYTHNSNIDTTAKVSVVIKDFVALKVNGVVQTNISSVPIVNGTNLFEFLTYNVGGPAYFAAYVTDSANNYLFSTNSAKTGWNIKMEGFYSNGYPLSSLLVGNAYSTEYINASPITTLTNYRTFTSDLSSNKQCKRINALNLNFVNNQQDLGSVFFTPPTV